jgi:hypothetical protein
MLVYGLPEPSFLRPWHAVAPSDPTDRYFLQVRNRRDGDAVHEPSVTQKL